MHQYSPERWPSPKAGNEVASPTVYREAETISTSLARAGSRAWALRTTHHRVCCVIYVHKNFYNRNVFFLFFLCQAWVSVRLQDKIAFAFQQCCPRLFSIAALTPILLCHFQPCYNPPIFAPLLFFAKTTWKIHIAEGEVGTSECFLLSLELHVFLQHAPTFELLF